MRALAVVLLFAGCLSAQFRSTVPLVVAPTTIKDARGNFIDGIEPSELVLYDNNVVRPVQSDYSVFPISLVVAVETNNKSGPMLGKLGNIGILLTNLMAGDRGETALLGFSESVDEPVPFTENPAELKKQLRSLRPRGEGAVVLDGLLRALDLLAARKPGRRPVILMIAESRDRNSQAKLDAVMERAQRMNVAVYWLTYSNTWMRYTNRNADLAPTLPEFDLLAPFTALAHLASPELAKVLPQVTGGVAINFLTRKAVESAIHTIGEEIHRQYILSFTPAASDGLFHRIRVDVKGRPELRIQTRDGYWAVQ